MILHRNFVFAVDRSHSELHNQLTTMSQPVFFELYHKHQSSVYRCLATVATST